MARKPRLHWPGALYHVTLRGNAYQDIFLDDTDRRRLSLLLEEGVERFSYRVHAFCWMTNHIHLAIQVGRTPLSRVAHNFAFRYTQWFNKRRGRVGHVFQGRYKAFLVDADSYLVHLVRYVHLNPVRAGLVRNPARYRWSSHRSYLGIEELPWVTTSPVLSQFSEDLERARAEFRQFVTESPNVDAYEVARQDSLDRRIVGDDSFAARALRKARQPPPKAVTLEQIVEAACRAYQTDKKSLAASGKNRPASEARAVIAQIVQETPGLSLARAGRLLGRDGSTLSAASTRLIARVASDAQVVRRIELVRDQLKQIAESHA